MWQCSCGFHNRACNAVCGGEGVLGCKAPGASAASTAPACEPEPEIPPRGENSLRLVTYNLWFSPTEQALRMAAVAKILEEADADVVALQEVTDVLLGLLLANLDDKQWQVLKQLPAHPEDLFTYETSYFTCLFVRRPARIIEHLCVRFTITAMARALQYVFLAVDGRTIIVATSHLESPVAKWSCQDIREQQLEEGRAQGDFMSCSWPY